MINDINSVPELFIFQNQFSFCGWSYFTSDELFELMPKIFDRVQVQGEFSTISKMTLLLVKCL